MIRFLFFYFLINLPDSLCNTPDSSQMIQDEPHEEYMDECRKYEDKNCSELSNMCLKCDNYTTDCIYGNWSEVQCFPKVNVNCKGEHEVKKQARCIFCYQTEKWEHICSLNVNQPCSSQTKFYRANCTAKPEVMCLGPRKFSMKLRCNVTRGHRWSTALILSITLGGFGADRFYLGHWQEGIGKLFSFGGLGVWTLVDVLLIAIRYLGPADGSFYV